MTRTLLVAAALASALAACRTPAPVVERDGPMTQERMEQILRELGENAEGRPGRLIFTHGNVRMACISDPEHDRMRIVAPIAEVEDVMALQLGAAMDANFHSALDARYATSNGIVYAAYVHPLSSLTEAELRSGASQVASLTRTFGVDYSSGVLQYHGGEIERR